MHKSLREEKVCLVKCVTEDDCPSGEQCYAHGECQSGCFSDNHCPSNSKCFKNNCLDPCDSNQKCSDAFYCLKLSNVTCI